MRCAIYARYSSDMQRPQSIEDQVRECRRHIERMGGTVADGHVYSDFAVSGSDDFRTGYQAMKAAARRKEWECLVVDDQSRLARHALEVLSAIEELLGLGIRIMAVADGLDTDSQTGKMTYMIKGVFNELFLDSLRESVRRGLKGQVERGYSAGGRVFGYRYTEILDHNRKDRLGRVKRDGVTIEIDPDQAEVVRTIFGLSARGFGLKAIASTLNETGIAAPRQGRKLSGNGTWCTGTIRAILRNPRYIGDWSYGKTRWVTVREGGKKKRRPVPQPPDRWQSSQRTDLQIIDKTTWDAVQSRTQTNVLRKPNGRLAGSRTNSGPAKYLFSGLLKCGECGSSLIVINSAYVCNGYWGRGKAVCRNNHRVPRRVIESDLLALLRRRFLDDRLFARLVERANEVLAEQSRNSVRDDSGLSAEAARLEAEIGNLVAFVAAGESHSIRQRLAECEKRLAEVQAQMARDSARAGLPHRIDADDVHTRLAELCAMLDRHSEQTATARLELANYFGRTMKVTPDTTGKNTCVVVEGNFTPAKALIGAGFQYSEIALRGFEPRFDG